MEFASAGEVESKGGGWKLEVAAVSFKSVDGASEDGEDDEGL